MAILEQTIKQPSAADRSNEAATAGQGSVHEIEVGYATPGGGQPDSQNVAGLGDQLIGSPVTAALTGGTELTVVPPEDPLDTYRVFKLSPLLSPVLDALCANVYASGFYFKPVVEPERPDAFQRVKDALVFKQALSAGTFETRYTPSDNVVNRELDRIRTRINNESQFAKAWFDRSCPGSTFRDTARLIGLDMEIQGDGYLEVLRDAAGFPSKLIWAPSWSIRAKPLQPDLVPVSVPVPISDFEWTTEVQLRRFRSYVQVDINGVVIARYKEYGDPRVLSRKTGNYYASIEEMYSVYDEWGKNANGQPAIPPQAATELLQFSLPNPLSTTYGKPTYTGIFPVLDGARDLEEENRTIIVDRKVPQMFILVAGGAGIPQKTIEALQEKIKQNAESGKKSIYVLQAQSMKSASGTVSPTPKMEIVKTKSEQYQDALGLNYLKHTKQEVRDAYRFPRSALGQHDDVRKDEAQEGYRFTEAQVYDPRRDIFGGRVNVLLRDLGIQLITFTSRSRPPKEPNELASIINILMTSGVLTPDEGRALAGDIFNKDFPDLVGIWSKLPTKLLTAMLQTKNQLVAAALLGSESESDIIGRLQQALMGQLQVAPQPGAGGSGMLDSKFKEKEPKDGKQEPGAEEGGKPGKDDGSGQAG